MHDFITGWPLRSSTNSPTTRWSPPILSREYVFTFGISTACNTFTHRTHHTSFFTDDFGWQAHPWCIDLRWSLYWTNRLGCYCHSVLETIQKHRHLWFAFREGWWSGQEGSLSRHRLKSHILKPPNPKVDITRLLKRKEWKLVFCRIIVLILFVFQ